MLPIPCLCFSYDRPFQLDGYIRSLKKHVPPNSVFLTVLFKTSESRFESGYAQLADIHTDVDFVREREFGSQVLEWLDSVHSPLVFFGCDDVMFYRPVHLDITSAALQNPNVLGFSLRLGTNIRFNHTRAQEVEKPAFLQETPFLRWNWFEYTADWGYPFELNGTIYRRAQVVHILHTLEKLSKKSPHPLWQHPNLLEKAANHLLRHNARNVPGELASHSTSCLVVPTVNQVQQIADNRIMGAYRSTHELEDLRHQGYQMNLEAYAAGSFDRVHVSEFHIHKTTQHA